MPSGQVGVVLILMEKDHVIKNPAICYMEVGKPSYFKSNQVFKGWVAWRK